jgi:hypothetical protein
MDGRRVSRRIQGFRRLPTGLLDGGVAGFTTFFASNSRVRFRQSRRGGVMPG